MPTRTPPTSIRKFLRKEAGFVCAKPGCDSPYLDYHHFDPPWAAGQAHKPEGMIALCKEHHGLADGGAWTIPQLRKFKTLGSVAASVSETVQWRREHTVFIFGGVVVYMCPVIISLMGQNIIWLTKDNDGNDLLNFKIFDATGSTAFEMIDNDWIAYPELDDLEVPPQGRSINISNEKRGVRLSVKFSDLQPDSIPYPLRHELGLVNSISEKGAALVCNISGELVWPRRMRFDQNGVHSFDHLGRSMSFVSGISAHNNYGFYG